MEKDAGTSLAQQYSLAQQLGRVAVLYGGVSAEREISLKSGAAVIQALREAGVDVVAVDIGNNAVQDILAAKADRAFIILHGPGGEDGKIQALLEFLKIPYTGSGVTASAICLDKLRCKLLFRGANLKTADHIVLEDSCNWGNVMESLGGDVMVKPNHEGSSLGMARAISAAELERAYQEAKKLDACVFAERTIVGTEYTVAILNGEVLPPIRLENYQGFFSFSAKYQSKETKKSCPCGLGEADETRLKRLALDAFNAAGCSGWARVDIMADENGEFYLLEINTLPGMTNQSLVPMAAQVAGYSFNELVLEIAKQSLV